MNLFDFYAEHPEHETGMFTAMLSPHREHEPMLKTQWGRSLFAAVANFAIIQIATIQKSRIGVRHCEQSEAIQFLCLI